MPVDKTPNPSLHKSIPLALPVAGQLGSYELREPDLKNLEHFLNSTASTLGGGRGVFETWYSQGVLGLGNSYFFLLHIFLVLSQLLVQPTPYNIHHFLSFLSQIDTRYQVLVREKDHRAMILLLYWMAKMVLYPMWWTRRRTLYEELTICIYIERYYGHDPEFMQLICHPRAVFSAVYSGVEVQKWEDVVLGFTPLKM